MAIALEGTATLFESASATAIVIPVPSGRAVGEVLVAAATATRNAAGNVINPPAGWTQLGFAKDTDSAGVMTGLWYRVVDNSEGASYTFTGTGAANRCFGAMIRLSGVDLTTPIDVAASTAFLGSGSATTIVAPTITTVTNGALLVSIAGLNSSGTQWTGVPTGMTVINVTTGTGRSSSWAWEVDAAAGATGTRTWTRPSGTQQAAVILGALRPATSSGVTGTAAQALPHVTQSADGTHTEPTVAGTAAQTLPKVTQAAAGEVDNPPVFTGTAAQTLTKVAQSAGGTFAPTPSTLTRRVVGPVSVGTRTGTATSVRLKCGTNSGVTTGVQYTSAETPDGLGQAFHDTTGLTPGVWYFRVAMTVSGVETLDVASTVGRLVIAPTGASDFAFCFSSCCDATDSDSMAAIATRADDLFFHVGDFWYADDTGQTVANFRSKMTAKLDVTNHAAVFTTIPSIYTPSDHDFGMVNNGTAATEPGAIAPFNQVHRENWPAPLVEATTGVYWTFPWGRLQFVVLDGRSFKDDPADTDNSSKTLLGTTQEAWVADVIADSTASVLVLVNDVPWSGATTAGEDDWAGYNTKRQVLATQINDAIDDPESTVVGALFLGGDMHAVGWSLGVTYAQSIANFQASPLNNEASIKGAPWAQVYPSSGGASVQQYGRVVVTDTGSNIELAFTGYSSDNTSRVSTTIDFDTPTPITGTAAQTLPHVTQSASGTAEAEYTGAAAQTLPRVTQSASGTAEAEYTGVIGQTLPIVGQAAAGTAEAEYEGVIAQVLPHLIQSGAGTITAPVFAGVISQELPHVTQSGVGTAEAEYEATSAQVLPHVTQIAAGTHVAPMFTGATAQALPHLTQSASGTFEAEHEGAIAQTLGRVTQSAVGISTTPVFTADISQILPVITQLASGTAEVEYEGTTAQTFSRVTQSLAGTATPPVFAGTIGQILPHVTQTVTGTAEAEYEGSVVQTLPRLTQAVVGDVDNPPGTVGLIDQSLQNVTQEALGTAEAEYEGIAAQTLPSITQAATGTHVAPVFTGTSAQILPHITQEAAGIAEAEYEGATAQVLPNLSQSGAGSFIAPVFIGTVTQALPHVVQAGAGSVDNPGFSGNAAQTLPKVEQAAAGISEAIYTGLITQSLPHLTQSGTGTFTDLAVPGTIMQTLPNVTQTGSGTAETVYTGTSAQVLPFLTQSGIGTITAPVVSGVANQMLPSIIQSGIVTFTSSVFTGTVAQTLPHITQSGSSTLATVTFTGVIVQTLPPVMQSAAGPPVYPNSTVIIVGPPRRVEMLQSGPHHTQEIKVGRGIST